MKVSATSFLIHWIRKKYPIIGIPLFGLIISFLIYVLIWVIINDWVIGISVAVLFFVVYVVLSYKLVSEKKKKDEV